MIIESALIYGKYFFEMLTVRYEFTAMLLLLLISNVCAMLLAQLDKTHTGWTTLGAETVSV